MSKWRTEKLGNIATYINGYPFKPDEWATSGLPIIRIQNLTDPIKSQYNYYDGEINRKYIVSKGDVLISWSASLGVYEWGLDTALLNQHIFKVEFNKLSVDKRYFILAVGQALSEMQRHVHGSTMKHIVKSAFDNIEIPLPPLPEQKRITETLDRAQRLIDLRKKQIEEMDRLAQAVFIEMFGDIINRNSNMMMLKDICHFIDYRGKTPTKSECGVPFITAKNVKNNSFVIEPREYISEDTYLSVMTRGIPEANDILFTTEAPLGNVCRIPNIFTKFSVGQRIIVLQPKKSIASSEYLEKALSMEVFQNKVLSRSSGSTVKGIRSAELELIDVSIPPINLQMEFSIIINNIMEEKNKMSYYLFLLLDLYDKLSIQYFS